MVAKKHLLLGKTQRRPFPGDQSCYVCDRALEPKERQRVKETDFWVCRTHAKVLIRSNVTRCFIDLNILLYLGQQFGRTFRTGKTLR